MNQKNHIIFDFDGTLADSFKLAINAANHYADSYGYKKVTQENIKVLRNSPPWEILRFYGVRLRLLPLIIRKGRRYMFKHVGEVELYPEIAGLIRRLDAADKKLYIVSSSMAKLINVVLEKYEIKHYFQDVVGGGKIMGKNRKIKKLMRRHRIPKDDAVYIGDEVRDIVACKKIKLPIVSVTRGYNEESMLNTYEPEDIAKSVNELGEKLI